LSAVTSKFWTVSAPIGCEKTNVSAPDDPVSVSSPDQAKMGVPGA
jgi:hypothetical protein